MISEIGGGQCFYRNQLLPRVLQSAMTYFKHVARLGQFETFTCYFSYQQKLQDRNTEIKQLLEIHLDKQHIKAMLGKHVSGLGIKLLNFASKYMTLCIYSSDSLNYTHAAKCSTRELLKCSFESLMNTTKRYCIHFVGTLSKVKVHISPTKMTILI